MAKKSTAFTTRMMPVESLTPYERNPRNNNPAVAAVMESIRSFGFRVPIIVDAKGVIIAGHTRLKAAIELGMKKVPVHTAIDLTAKQARALRLADNKTAELAEWDMDLLAEELAAICDGGTEMMAFGFTEAELAELTGVTEGQTDPDDVPELDDSEPPDSEAGALYLLGNHRLLCGDSTSADDVARLMGGEKVDLCFTSPPYGAGNVAKLRDHYVRGSSKRESFYDQHADDPDAWYALMAGWYDAIRPKCECVVCNVQMLADNKRSLVAWVADRSDDLCDVIVWDKGHAAPQMQRNVLSNAFELCFVFGGNGSRSIPFADFHGTMSNVIRINTTGKNKYSDKHRAVFPMELPKWFIHSLCTKARTVVDPFLGSGTTIIACEQLGRSCFGMEISPKYCDIIRRRWAEFVHGEDCNWKKLTPKVK